ncbi:hypothetical protein N7510_010383 [Penicillium lagena]|uniref:uncharacterized protein n=1 Tax=Penicillium lagena TaxID=94218 RepID=UPI0025421736|nr:uncharacterized protein N7510_010383 [Penicillium lagena]KAJ5605229.1 hypothetical protein N7510_010383 [Penicillium lagena]
MRAIPSEPITCRYTQDKGPRPGHVVLIRSLEHLKTHKLRRTPSKHSSPVSLTCGDWTGDAGIIGEWWVGIFVPFGIARVGPGRNFTGSVGSPHLQPGDPVDLGSEESEKSLEGCVRPQPLVRWDGNCLFE